MSTRLDELMAELMAEKAAKKPAATATATTAGGRKAPPAIGAADEKFSTLVESVGETVNGIEEASERKLARTALKVFCACFLATERRYLTVFRPSYVSQLAETLGLPRELVYRVNTATKTESGLIPQVLVPGVLQLTWAGRTPTVGLAGSVTGTYSTSPVTDTLMKEAEALLLKHKVAK